MSIIDSIRQKINQKNKEIVILLEKKASEQKKIADLSAKIQSAKRSQSSSKSISIIQSKEKEINSNNEKISKIEIVIADLEKKIAQKQKEIAIESKRLTDEEIKESKKYIQLQTDLQKKQTQAFSKITNKLIIHDNEINSLKELPNKITVLFFASNPRDQLQLQLDEEVRSIQDMIRKSKHRDAVKLESMWAVRPSDILQGLNEYLPTIVHFSGHGSSENELVLLDNSGNTKLVSLNAIVQVMASSVDSIKLVFFNTCFSFNQANEVTKYVDAAIGMNTSISDEAAKIFSSQFYSSIGFGLSVKKSFEQAKGMLMIEGIEEENTPMLFVKEGINSDELFIVSKNDIK